MNEEQKKDDLRLEILEKFSALATAAFGLVAALAWNTAIQALFTSLFGEQSTIIAKFVYALLVTVIVVIITLRLSHSVNALKERIAHHDNHPKV